MYGFAMLLGWVATTALTIILWRRRRPGRNVIPGVLIGLLAGVLWPITLWIALGLWWYWRGLPALASPQARAAQVSQAMAFAQQSEIEGMAASAAYWRAEAQRLTAANGAANVTRQGTSAGIIVSACVVGSIATFAVIGATGPEVEPQPAATTGGQTTTSAAPTTTSPPTPPSDQEGEQVTISSVVDGDTVELGDGRIVRVLGIDSPELSNGADCYGIESARFAHETLNGRTVRLVSDPTQDRVDRYERTLAYLVLPGDRNYSVLAASAGAAFSYTAERPVRLSRQIERAESDARTTGQGIWGPPCFGNVEGTTTPPPPPAQPPAPNPVSEPEPASSCETGYDPCVPPFPPDLDCADVDGPIAVTGSDPHNLDGDGDGVACE